MNPLACDLNNVLSDSPAGNLLSPFGKKIFFPKGIIAQAAEAKQDGYFANAAIGMAVKNGNALTLSVLDEGLASIGASRAVLYAPTAGEPGVRKAWLDSLLKKNPSLKKERISLPVVVPGLTAGISYTANLFLGEGDRILTCDPSWDNYSLIFSERHSAEIKEVPFFKEGLDGLDIEGIEKALRKEAESGSLRLILNFPQNPSGYSPSSREAEKLVQILTDIANSGTTVLVLVDDAYFGLTYEPDIYPESLFALLSQASKNLLAVKIDGPTKEDYVWGLRMGFITFGSKSLTPAHSEALEKKLMGTIRSSVSCSNTPAQLLMLKTMEDSRSAGEKAKFKALLKNRYQKVKDFLLKQGPHPLLNPLPFNSGYFMSFCVKNEMAETLRTRLLKKHGIGTIAMGPRYLRVAFSSVEDTKLTEVYTRIWEEATALAEEL